MKQEHTEAKDKKFKAGASHNWSDLASDQVAEAIEVIEAKCRLNQIQMAINTLTDDKFLIFKKIAKEIRLCSKDPKDTGAQSAQ